MRKKFYEMLSSMSSHVINDEKFIVSPARAIDGIKSRVTIVPRFGSNIYGQRNIEYKRFDLSTVEPVVVTYEGEQLVHDIVTKIALVALFKYSIRDRTVPTVLIPRFLFLSTDDIVNNTLPSIISQPTTIKLEAQAESDFFVGSLSISLHP